MLLPTNAGDPASMVAQAVAIFKQASNASIQLQSASNGNESSLKEDEQGGIEESPSPASDDATETDKPQQTDKTKFSLQKRE